MKMNKIIIPLLMGIMIFSLIGSVSAAEANTAFKNEHINVFPSENYLTFGATLTSDSWGYWGSLGNAECDYSVTNSANQTIAQGTQRSDRVNGKIESKKISLNKFQSGEKYNLHLSFRGDTGTIYDNEPCSIDIKYTAS